MQKLELLDLGLCRVAFYGVQTKRVGPNWQSNNLSRNVF